MASPYSRNNTTEHSAGRYGADDALQRRMEQRRINGGLADNLTTRSGHESAEKPLRFTNRAKNLGAAIVSAAALGGVLWAGIHANNEANRDYDQTHPDQDGTSQTHNPGEHADQDEPSLIDKLQGDK